jgi:hypothetical protein
LIENKKGFHRPAWSRRIATFMVSLLALNLVTSLTIGTSAAAPIPVSNFPPLTTPQTKQLLAENPARLGQAGYTNLLNTSLANGDSLNLGSDNYAPPRWSGAWADYGMYTSQPKRFDEPFNNLDVSWTSRQPAGTSIEVDVRVSPDNRNWTLWQTLDTSGQTASFGTANAFLYAQYRARLFSDAAGKTPNLDNIKLEANRRDLNNLNTSSYFSLSNITSDSPTTQAVPAPTFSVYATREGLVGWRTANGHIIQPNDHFVSLPSWTALNDLGSTDYMVKITAPNGRTAIAPVMDVGPWNFKDNYWHNPRYEFKDLPVGVPQAEKAYYNDHNGGLNESGVPVGNPSGIDIGDGTYWDDLGLAGASAGKLDVTFLWEGSAPPAAGITDVSASGAWHNGVVIRWSTNVATNGWVEYGLSDRYGQTSYIDNNMVSSHTFVLTDLVPGQDYNYRVHSKDIYGNEVVSANQTFETLPGVTTSLVTYQNDKGIGLTLGKNSQSLKLLGARINPTYWSDNPNNDYLAGASTKPGALTASGNLDLDFVPVCDENDRNCVMGFGSGYKNFVRFTNSSGENYDFGAIHDFSLSPNAMAAMLEANFKDGSRIRRYGTPDSYDQKWPHHYHFFWWDNKILFSYDNGKPEVFDFNLDGLTISFVGASRAQGDIVGINFQNIAFSPNGLNPDAIIKE